MHETARELSRTNVELSTQLRALQERQRHLEDARAQNADLFDFAPVTYALLDPAGVVLKINLAGCRLLKAERARLIAHPLLTFVLPDDHPAFLEHLRRCRAGSRVVETELRFGWPGRAVICRLYSKRTTYEGQDAYPTVIVDQSEHLALDDARLGAERRQAHAERESQAAQEANAAKDRFLATVSHELRTPLTPALFAASRLAAWDGLPDQARRLAAIVERNIAFEASLIDDLLDVARISRGRISLQFATVNAHEALKEAIGICAAYAEAKDVAMALHADAESYHVQGDRARLRQVFWNLLNNAIKFTEPGGRVVIQSSNAAGDVLRVSVRDNGAGMEQSVVDRLFAPFDRAISLPESRAGLGLGLAICKGIVGAHGGQIWATSDGPARGSTFAVEFATVAPGVDDRGTAQAKALGRPETSEPLRILVVEDDADSGEMLSLFLSQFGCAVEVVSSLRASLGKLDQPWDIVLSDIGLPDGSGLEVARRARQAGRGPQRLIALTGYGSADDIKASRDAGFDEHVVKPIDLDRLLNVLGLPACPPLP